MSVVEIRDLAAHEGERVTLRGWVFQFRSSGGLAFLQVRDGTGEVQVVVSRRDVDAASWTVVERVAPDHGATR